MPASASSRTLLLVPTQLELRELSTCDELVAQSCRIELCGFGPVAAAARTSQLIAQYQPGHVTLIGIAGTYESNRLNVGAATCFDRVGLFGVGAGTGSRFVTGSTMGFPQWPGEQHSAKGGIFDEIQLADVGHRNAGMLLTCCAASASPGDVQDRLRHFPDAVAEDMEGFGVALACKLAGVPVSIVRGISNIAGDRQSTNWQIVEALRAASQLAIQVIKQFNHSEQPG